MIGAYNYLDRSAAAHGARTAVVFGQDRLDYRTLQRLTFMLANRLMEQGLEPGARIATLMPNHPVSFICQFGIDRTPYCWLPLNPRAAMPEAIGILADFGAQWLFLHSDFAHGLDEIRRQVPTLKGCVFVDAPFDAAPSLADWLEGAADHDPEIAMGPFDTAVLRTTGGSTGKPKGVMRTHMCQILQAADYGMLLPYDKPPVNLVLTPLSHAAGSAAMAIFAAGGTQVILASTDPADILACIEEYRVTTIFMPPTLIYTLLTYPDIHKFDLSSLVYVIYGSAPMSAQKLREAWHTLGPVFTQIYGLTEASSTIAIMTPAEHQEALDHYPARLASCGRGSPNYKLKILAADGKPAGPGELGEILCASNEVMSGYFEDPVATREAIRDGWLHTGDIGYRDEHGYLYVVDRIKDLIISGGFNVYPGEVEQVIFRHAAIKDCTVVGIPDDKWGEAVTAVVELKPGCTLDAAELIKHCRAQLSGVKSPKHVFVWESLPRSPAGKVLKKDVRAHYWRDANRAI